MMNLTVTSDFDANYNKDKKIILPNDDASVISSDRRHSRFMSGDLKLEK